jgi:hypothetical protein
MPLKDAAKTVQLVGQVLQETYRIERLLGRGGKGEVYLASHMRLPRRFAIKVLFPHNVFKSEEVLRFRREAEVVSALGHPNIIEVIDFNHTTWGSPYIVMEYLEGEDLSARLQRAGRLPLIQTAAILKQVCSALHAAHQRGIVHRDLKPSNIFLCRKGDQQDYVKVVDFGLSKVWGAQTVVTAGRLAIGTPRYMAPEQAMGRSAEADARADIFSLGAILYRMLTGELPFMGDSIQALLNAIVFTDPPPMRETVPEIPEAVEHVVARALRKRPEDRFQSVESLSAAFDEAAGLPSSQAVVVVVEPSGAQRPKVEPSGPTPRLDPHPELSGTYAHATGEVMQPEVRGEKLRRRRTAWLVAGATMGVVVVAVGGLGLWLGLRLVRPDSPPVVTPGGSPAGLGADLAPLGQDHDAAPATVSADASAGGLDHERVRLRTKPPTPPPKRRRRPGGLHVVTRRHGGLHVITRSDGQLAWADVYVDGRKVGQSPQQLDRLPAGVHRVEVRRPGFRPRVRKVRVLPGRTVKVILDLKR